MARRECSKNLTYLYDHDFRYFLQLSVCVASQVEFNFFQRVDSTETNTDIYNTNKFPSRLILFFSFFVEFSSTTCWTSLYSKASAGWIFVQCHFLLSFIGRRSGDLIILALRGIFICYVQFVTYLCCLWSTVIECNLCVTYFVCGFLMIYVTITLVSWTAFQTKLKQNSIHYFIKTLNKDSTATP